MNKNHLLLKPKTIENRNKIKRVYFDPFVKLFNGRINALEAYEILDKKKLSPVTMYVTMTYLMTMCKEENIPYDEIEMTKVIKFLGNRAKGIKRKALTDDEAMEVLQVTLTNFPVYYPLVLFGLHTGARKGEMLGLEWRDLVKTNGKCYILIRRTIGEETTKNGLAKKIPVSVELKKALEKMFVQYVKRKNKHNRKFKTIVRSARVFERMNVNTLFKKLRPLLSFKKPVSFHILRHTFATTLLNKNVIPKDVQQMMGHTSVATTLDMYWTRPVDLQLDGFLPSITIRSTNGPKKEAKKLA